MEYRVRRIPPHNSTANPQHATALHTHHPARNHLACPLRLPLGSRTPMHRQTPPSRTHTPPCPHPPLTTPAPLGWYQPPPPTPPPHTHAHLRPDALHRLRRQLQRADLVAAARHHQHRALDAAAGAQRAVGGGAQQLQCVRMCEGRGRSQQQGRTRSESAARPAHQHEVLGADARCEVIMTTKGERQSASPTGCASQDKSQPHIPIPPSAPWPGSSTRPAAAAPAAGSTVGRCEARSEQEVSNITRTEIGSADRPPHGQAHVPVRKDANRAACHTTRNAKVQLHVLHDLPNPTAAPPAFPSPNVLSPTPHPPTPTCAHSSSLSCSSASSPVRPTSLM
mgnify:CR=1 FL=1